MQRNASTNIRPVPKPLVVSRTTSAGNVDAEWTHDLHGLNNLSTSRDARKTTRTEQLYAAFSGKNGHKVLDEQVNIVKSAPSKSFSIRGLAGPYTVIAKNFAHGTTAADIESALVQRGGVILDCHLLSERPTVVAEITFETKHGADVVVETFDKQNVGVYMFHVLWCNTDIRNRLMAIYFMYITDLVLPRPSAAVNRPNRPVPARILQEGLAPKHLMVEPMILARVVPIGMMTEDLTRREMR